MQYLHNTTVWEKLIHLVRQYQPRLLQQLLQHRIASIGSLRETLAPTVAA